MADIHDLTRAGLTTRQADHWTRKGWLRAENADCGSGAQRRWPVTEVDVARTMARLTAAGLTVKAAHSVARGQTEIGPGVIVQVREVPRDG